MSDPRANATPRQQAPRLLTFSGGGWVLLLAGLIGLALLAYVALHTTRRATHRPPGDGRTIESYRFDLSTCLVPREHIKPGHPFRDLHQAMIQPSTLTAAEVLALQQGRKKYLVPGDRVIGVSLNGQSRAYPLMVLHCHEIINDTLGGVPIAVTYDLHGDAAVVLDRRPRTSPRTSPPAEASTVDDSMADSGGAMQAAVTFGVSGLLCQGLPLMYDRRDDGGAGGESLWSPLLAQAVAGTAAADAHRLAVLPMALTSWGDWLHRHPDTTVLARDLTQSDCYTDSARYAQRYLRDPRLPAGIEPPPDAGVGLAPKARVVAVLVNDQRRVYSLADLIARADEQGVVRDAIAGAPARLICKPVGEDLSIVVEPDGEGSPAPAIMHACWFAWRAMYPETEIAR